MQELGNPIFTTSLRIEGQEPDYEVNAELIKEKYGSRVDLIIDGGLGVNSLSTVVDCTGDDFEIIRQGIGELIL